MTQLGILGSGNGSNFQAILDAIGRGELDARVAVVLCDQPGAKILDRARNHGIPAMEIDCRGFRSKFTEEAQEEVVASLQSAGVDLVCLAGFMRMIGRPLLAAYPGRILNLHPSLLPDFPGLDAWQQALDAGVAETGCTVHVVDEGMDTGPVLAQSRVPVLAEDTAESLLARIHEAEHALYPSTIAEYSGRL